MAELQKHDLKNKVIEWLSQEGYSLEFLTAFNFQKGQFNVSQGTYVRDDLNNCVRDIDVLATLDMIVSDINIRIHHVIECKWSKDKPWIVFTSKKSISPGTCISQTIGSRLGQAVLWHISENKQLFLTDYFKTPDRPGFGGRQSLTNGKDLFYTAMQSVTTNSRLVANRYDSPASLIGPFPKIAVIVFPLIVIKGTLFEAYYDEMSAKVNIEEVNHTRIHWNGAESWKLNATVDIITSDYLEEFVKRRYEESHKLFMNMKASVLNIKQCYDHGSLRPLIVSVNSLGAELPPLLENIRIAEISRGNPIK